MKGLTPTNWPRAIVSPISTMFSQAVSGFGSKHRRKVQALRGALADAEAECDRLRNEMQDLVQYTDAELTQLKQERDRLQRERDELHLKVMLLEEELETATASLGSKESKQVTPAPTDLAGATVAAEFVISDSLTQASSVGVPLLDLSDFRLALIGGHPSTRRGVIEELQLHYGLKHFVEIPRMSEVNTSRNRVKSKIHRCNLVVLITGYMSHRLTEIVFSLKDAGALAGEVLQLNCKGKSGVLRGIIEHVESKAT